MTYNLLLYRSANLGDILQTLAISRLLPPCHGVYRHRLGMAPLDRLFIVNGMLDKDSPPTHGPRCLFAGVSGPHFRHKAYLRWLAQSPYPIGARDPATHDRLQAAGIASVLAGCATLTLPRYDGPRSGAISVDCDGPGRRTSHRISRKLPLEEQWRRAIEALDAYRTAAEVHTTRLHVAMPCLAMGTPVRIADPRPDAWHPDRFGILEELGVEYGKLVAANVGPAARRYTEFLAAQLGRAVEAGEPNLPVSAYRPGAWIPGWWRW